MSTWICPVCGRTNTVTRRMEDEWHECSGCGFKPEIDDKDEYQKTLGKTGDVDPGAMPFVFGMLLTIVVLIAMSNP